jgi:hypothetical protein
VPLANGGFVHAADGSLLYAVLWHRYGIRVSWNRTVADVRHTGRQTSQPRPMGEPACAHGVANFVSRWAGLAIVPDMIDDMIFSITTGQGSIIPA